MGKNFKKFLFGIEIIYNSLGQIYFKKRFLVRSTNFYFRRILRGS